MKTKTPNTYILKTELGNGEVKYQAFATHYHKASPKYMWNYVKMFGPLAPVIFILGYVILLICIANGEYTFKEQLSEQLISEDEAKRQIDKYLQRQEELAKATLELVKQENRDKSEKKVKKKVKIKYP